MIPAYGPKRDIPGCQGLRWRIFVCSYLYSTSCILKEGASIVQEKRSEGGPLTRSPGRQTLDPTWVKLILEQSRDRGPGKGPL